ncbi:hypothetical protein PUNSTDRAFT_145102 [Punctularia strigosozonata HHB-11173 SS5]|uniref:uncharacterized protein n=1 Tax=Punctularia strigosozonata (strain HHB-11173) TaxID=741275 RepID=UPI000441796A|nr:uncharacterized protein PUNSTDRAFT_145102 [Punctularia strigosozonata HHB-11173 SS5]EIN06525.1 hypothetical protein PUNSTDRAFT_145102 [Punctularia strigosozonata HHB-11173 SS5]
MAFHFDETRKYKIINVKGGTYMRVEAATVSGWDFNRLHENEKISFLWTIEKDRRDGQIALQSDDGKYLGFIGKPEEVRDGTTLILGSHPTFWDVQLAETVTNEAPAYKIVLPGTDYVVDLSDDGNSKDGTIIHLWKKHSQPKNQEWRFEHVEEGRPHHA